MRRVLVTRPEPGASRTADRLKALGFEPAVLPLTRIEPMRPASWPDPAGFAAVAVASANAVRHATDDLLRQISHLPVYAVGERTGAAARECGLTVADATAGDADRLAGRVAGALSPGASVLILCGRVRRDTLERGLSGAGFDTHVVETYDTLPLAPGEAELHDLLRDAPIEAALLYSAFAAEAFGRLVEREAAAKLFREALFVAISGRVAEALPAGLRGRARVAREPTEDAMLTLLSA